MANMKRLTAKSCPNTEFKLSTVGKGTIEVDNGFDAQLKAVTNSYQSVSDSLRVLSSQISSDADKHKKDFDNKKIQNLKQLAKVMKTHAIACDKRKNAMQISAKKDSQSIRNAVLTTSWKEAINAIVTDEKLGLSKETIDVLTNLRDNL